MLNREEKIAALDKIAQSWRELNRMHFHGILTKPVFTLEGPPSLLGSFHRRTGLYMNPQLIQYGNWSKDVIPVLKHEMAHQYIIEHIDPEATGHGPLFKKLCQKIDAPYEATGRLPTKPQEPAEPKEETKEEVIFRRVEKLMQLAQSDNINEAEAAMTKANQLLLKYNIEQLSPTHSDYTRLDIALGKKVASAEVSSTSVLLQEFYFVDLVFFRDWDVGGLYSMHLAIMGKRTNVQIAQYVFDYLCGLANRLWTEQKGYPSSKSRRLRREFMLGLFDGLHSKLTCQRQRDQRAGLVWKGDPELLQFAKTHFPRTRRTSSAGSSLSDTYQQAHRMGQDIVISKVLHNKDSQPSKRYLAAPRTHSS